MRHGVFLLMIVEQFGKILLIVLRNRIRTLRNIFGVTVFIGEGGIAGESVKANNTARIVVRLVDGPKRLKQHHVLTPPHAEFYDDAWRVDDLLIQLIDVEKLCDNGTSHEEREICDSLIG